MKVLTFVMIVALLYHVWVGVRDIWMDYVQSASSLRLLPASFHHRVARRAAPAGRSRSCGA
jgi:succinate dehydrogenase hydrophobic membrane anchor protein